VNPAVGFLADLAGTGAALELGIGTGRIALPLSQRGVRVHGIELSPEMIAQLRAQPGAGSIGVTPGDFVIEVYVPELRRLPPGETVHAFTVTPAHLRERWSGWNREPFTSNSRSHVSVWEKP
jgi:hypothetical protein